MSACAIEGYFEQHPLHGHGCTCNPGGPHEGCDEFDGGPEQDPDCPQHGNASAMPRNCDCGSCYLSGGGA